MKGPIARRRFIKRSIARRRIRRQLQRPAHSAPGTPQRRG